MSRTACSRFRATSPPSPCAKPGTTSPTASPGATLAEARRDVAERLAADRALLDELAAQLVRDGLAVWAGEPARPSLVVSGRARLLAGVRAEEELERVQKLFAALEAQESVLKLLRLAETAEGVQIFIGAGSGLFSVAGVAAIVAPCLGRDRAAVGAIGVIGPSRLDYARIIPMVDYTAEVVRDLAEGGGGGMTGRDAGEGAGGRGRRGRRGCCRRRRAAGRRAGQGRGRAHA